MRCVFCSEDLKNLKEQQEHTQASHQDQNNHFDRLRNWEQKKAFVKDTENSVNQARVRLYKSLQLLKLPNGAHRAMDVPSCVPIDGYMRGPLIRTQLSSNGYNQSTIFSAASREAAGPPSTETGDSPSKGKGNSLSGRAGDDSHCYPRLGSNLPLNGRRPRIRFATCRSSAHITI